MRGRSLTSLFYQQVPELYEEVLLGGLELQLPFFISKYLSSMRKSSLGEEELQLPFFISKYLSSMRKSSMRGRSFTLRSGKRSRRSRDSCTILHKELVYQHHHMGVGETNKMAYLLDYYWNQLENIQALICRYHPYKIMLRVQCTGPLPSLYLTHAFIRGKI
jgi:hypothetical protein